MTPEQFGQLIALFTKILEKPHTITGAADWPLLAWMIGGTGAFFLVFFTLMWSDLRSDRSERKAENDKQHDLLWDALRDCKHECCPRRRIGDDNSN
jgi:hypothetical protein